MPASTEANFNIFLPLECTFEDVVAKKTLSNHDDKELPPPIFFPSYSVGFNL